ncbi:MAG: hypothetical protein ACFE9I_17915 [Candidatus Hermodarchaeota archaeon]
MEKKNIKENIGKRGEIFDDEGKAYAVEDWSEKQRQEDFKKELQRIIANGRTNKERIRDYVVQNQYATRKELINYFTNKNGILQIMSPKTVDNNLKSLREEKTLILIDPINLTYVYNIEKPFIPTEYTSERTLKAYHITKESRDYSRLLKKHEELKTYLGRNIGYKIYYKGQEEKDFYFSNQNMRSFVNLMVSLLYKCFIMNPDLFYRFRNKEDFYFSLLITINIDKDPNFEDFFDKYTEMKEIIFRSGFPTEAAKIKTQKDTKEFIKYYEERQRAVAKFQQEQRDKGIKEILSLRISDEEKNIKIQELLSNLESEVYSKFSTLRIQDFDKL